MESIDSDKFFFLVLTLFGRFFEDPDPTRIFLPIRIRTLEKKSDLDLDERTQIRHTGIYKIFMLKTRLKLTIFLLFLR